MINHSHSLICQKVLLDKEGVPTYVDVMKSLGTRHLPRALPKLILVTSWENGLEDLKEISFEVRAQVISASGKKVFNNKSKAEIVKFSNIHFNLNGLEIKEYGRYVATVSLKTKENWKKCIEVPFYIFNPDNE